MCVCAYATAVPPVASPRHHRDRPDPAEIGLFKDKRKGVAKCLMGSQPYEAIIADIDIAVESFEVGSSHLGIEAIGHGNSALLAWWMQLAGWFHVL